MQTTLTPSLWDFACDAAHKRQSLNDQRGWSPPAYDDAGGTHLDRHVVGAIAECALASALGDDVLERWKREQAYSEQHWTIPCDVGVNLHVRATQYPGGKLVTHPTDPDGGVFVLAVVAGPAVSFLGWMLGSETKQTRWWRDSGPGFGKRPAYGVPQSRLKPMDTLPVEAIR